MQILAPLSYLKLSPASPVRPALLAILSFGLFLASGQAAVVINVDINGSATAAYTLSGQGAYSDPGNNLWNGFNLPAGFGNSDVSTGPLLDSTGASTGGVQLTLNLTGSGGYWQGFNYTSYGSLTTGNLMMDDMIYMLPSNFTDPRGLKFTLSGLAPNTAYTLYLYGDSGTDPKATTWTVNGTTATTTGRNSAVTPAIYTQGTDYALFNSAMTDGSGNLVGYFTQASGSGQGRFSGLQLIAVPEPQTWALAVLGASAIILQFRRKQREA